MPVATDSDLKEILARFDKMEQKFDKKFEQIDQRFTQIDQRLDQMDKKFDKIEDKIDNIQKDIIDLKVSQTKLEGKINGLQTTMSAEISGLGKRIDNQEFLNRTVVAGIVLALLTIVMKTLVPNLLT